MNNKSHPSQQSFNATYCNEFPRYIGVAGMVDRVPIWPGKESHCLGGKNSHKASLKCEYGECPARSDSPQPALGSAKKIRFGADLKAKSGPWSGPLRRFYHLNDHEIFVTVQSRPVLMSIEIPSSLSFSFLFISPPSFLPLFRPFLDHTNCCSAPLTP